MFRRDMHMIAVIKRLISDRLGELRPAIVEDGEWMILVDEKHPAYLAMAGTSSRIAGAPSSAAHPKIWGPPKWAELHQWASNVGTVTVADLPGVLAWLTRFGASIPCGECRDEWREIMRTPPRIGDDAFAWTVATHNRVNAKLGRAAWSVAAAREKYTPIDPPSNGG